MINDSKSVFLHAVRWIAALIVLVGHAQMYVRQKVGAAAFEFEYIGDHAHAAVMVFFVLSGFVIAWSVDKNSSLTWKKYYLDRFTRIYSVLPLAIGFTLILDFVGSQFSDAYSNPALIPQDGYLIRLLINIFSLQGIQGYRVQLGSNAALWSVGYEFMYYILFGLIFFWREIFRSSIKLAIIVLLSLFILAGIKISLYFLIWLLGVAAYKIQKSVELSRTFFWIFLILALLINHFVVYNALGDVEYLRDFSLALIIAGLFIPTSPLIKALKFNKFMADFSYSLYAIHMPILFFAYYVIYDETMSIKWFTFNAISASLIIGWIFSILAEKKRFILRDWLSRKIDINAK